MHVRFNGKVNGYFFAAFGRKRERLRWIKETTPILEIRVRVMLT